MLRYAKSLTLATAMGVSLLAMVGSARADIIPTLKWVTPSGSDFRWTYQANLTVDEKVNKYNFFTIYDFVGFIPGSNLQPANWVFSSTLLGKTPSKVLPDDDPKIPNLTWKYTGNTVLGPGTLNLGLFSALSHYGNQAMDDFAAEATKYAPGEVGNNKPIDNVGSVGVPTSAVPEPCSLALLGLGAAPLLARRRRARSQA
jgi:hypothetical protein